MLIARRDLKALKLKKKQNDTAALLSKIREIFTDDQIAVLKNNKRVQKWSNESIIKALRLRFAYGGYEPVMKNSVARNFLCQDFERCEEK